jgi:glycosyltransferase involved in cell wall biosynthesis
MDISGAERQSVDGNPEVSIIVPARNEEASLGDCLRSLVAQTGVDFEIIVVDDGSTDQTREIAETIGSKSGNVRVISAQPLPPRWTGKNNAVVSGVSTSRGKWLLFTDADTVHLPGSLARALTEAMREKADLLSYSPEQVVVSFAERSVMPVVFAELATHYPLAKVRDQNSGIVAANGQYILTRRGAYNAVGTHAAVAGEILEDVALAKAFRAAGFRVFFRYGGDAVRTRMYRNWAQLRDGWTKNLALLFPHSRRLALQSLVLWFVAWSSLGLVAYGAATRSPAWIAFAVFPVLVYRRIRAAHFTTSNNLIAIALGLPIFAYLPLRSRKAHASGSVSWKGRGYDVSLPNTRIPAQGQGRPTRLPGIG